MCTCKNSISRFSEYSRNKKFNHSLSKILVYNLAIFTSFFCGTIALFGVFEDQLKIEYAWYILFSKSLQSFIFDTAFNLVHRPSSTYVRFFTFVPLCW